MYLEHCLESIIKQSISFQHYIEVVLVDDGSKDRSSFICQEYSQRFPDNIQYIRQKNAGASTARNVGIRSARGEIIGFVDADDYISKDCLAGVVDFFESSSEGVDAAIVRVIQVGHGSNTERSINKKFENGTRVVDLHNSEWFDISPRVAPSFIKANVAKSYEFATDVRIYEDSRYLGEVLSEKMKLGVIAQGAYYNRKHDENDSSISITTGASAEKRFYTDSPEGVSLYLLESSKKKFGHIPSYYQYLAIYEMLWRVFHNLNDPRTILDSKAHAKYQLINKKILANIDDDSIIKYEGLSRWQKVYLLNIKHEENIVEAATVDDLTLNWNGFELFDYSKNLQVMITHCYSVGSKLVIKGYYVDFIEKVQPVILVNGEEHEEVSQVLNHNAVPPSRNLLEYDMCRHTNFTAEIPLLSSKRLTIEFATKIDDQYVKAPGVFVAPRWRLPKANWSNEYIFNRGVNNIVIAKNVTTNKLIMYVSAKRNRATMLAYKKFKSFANNYNAKNPAQKAVIKLAYIIRSRLIK